MQDCTEEGRESQRQELMKGYLPKVRAVAVRVLNELGLPLSMLPDVEAYGHQGLVRAGALYDFSRPVQFATFAEYKVRYACRDGLRAWRRGQALFKQLRATGADSDRGAMAEVDRYGEDICRMAVAATATELEADAGHIVDDDAVTPEDLAAKQEQVDRLQELLQELEPRRREVLLATYIDELKGKDIAHQLGITPSSVSHMNKRTLAALRKKMGEDEDSSDEDTDEPA